MAGDRYPCRNFRRVLSIDGGGLRGIIPARVLEELEEIIKKVAEKRKLQPKDGKATGHIHLADYFDVVAGTSAGALLASYFATKGQLGPELVQQCQQHLLQQPPPDWVKDELKDDLNPAGRLWEPDHFGNLTAGSARAAQAIFLAKASEIFPVAKPPALLPAHLVSILSYIRNARRVKYTAEGIDAVLQCAFGGKEMTLASLADAHKLHASLYIQAFDVDLNRGHAFWYAHDKTMDPGAHGYAVMWRTMPRPERSNAHKMAPFSNKVDLILMKRHNFRLWEAIRASAAAPTFLPAMRVTPFRMTAAGSQPLDVHQMVDGGLVANNPTRPATVFASILHGTAGAAGSRSNNLDLQDLAVLSLGCGYSPGSKLHSIADDAGQLPWVKGPLIGVLMSGRGTVDAAMDCEILPQAMKTTLESGQYTRIDIADPDFGLPEAARTNGTHRLWPDDELTLLPLEVDGQTITVPVPTVEVDAATQAGRDLTELARRERLDRNRPLGAAGDEKRPADVLSRIDATEDIWHLLEMGRRLATDDSFFTRESLTKFVEDFVLVDPEEQQPQPANGSAAHPIATADVVLTS
ncbi:hypothetical protein WJX72_008224 [[Myrmecia] bisecta]|uniref:Patatin n=1 Tax=[Myrmecia] bisecta TaxID=41462 RepID=A0AAW1PPU5_9CHLO